MGQRDSSRAQQEQIGNILLRKHLWVVGAELLGSWQSISEAGQQIPTVTLRQSCLVLLGL